MSPMTGIICKMPDIIPNMIPIMIITMYQIMYFPHPMLDILPTISLNLKAAPSSSYKAIFAIAIIQNNSNMINSIPPIILVTPNPTKANGFVIAPLTNAVDPTKPTEITIKGIMKYAMLTTSTFRPSINKSPKSSNSGRSS